MTADAAPGAVAGTITPEAARAELLRRLAEESAAPVHPAVATLVEHVRAEHGPTVAAVLFYGSCLRQGEALDLEGGLLDLYVLVDRYRDAYPSRLTALANRLLPPNVFYVEPRFGAGRVRAKYAVMTLARFRRGMTAPRQVTFWARFAQPARLVYARDTRARDEALAALADAARTFTRRALPLVGQHFTADALWTRGLEATYGAELRSETAGRALTIAALDRARNAGLTPLALRAGGLRVGEGREPDGTPVFTAALDPAEAERERRLWATRRRLGKPLNVLRLVKAVFTFTGGVDYALYKIERHAGRRPEVTEWERRHPILAAPFLLWRLVRGGFIR